MKQYVFRHLYTVYAQEKNNEKSGMIPVIWHRRDTQEVDLARELTPSIIVHKTVTNSEMSGYPLCSLVLMGKSMNLAV